MFLDESGIDRRESPYEVLAGVAIEDAQLWSLICRVQDAEERFFGQRVSQGALELKAKSLLKRKTFRLARQMSPIDPGERRILARSCLEKGVRVRGSQNPSNQTRRELTALAQAKLAFSRHLLELCGNHFVRIFATIVPKQAPRPEADFLRKDYAYLFERFFYFLEDRPGNAFGLVMFDELERSQCHLLSDQMRLYFQETATGRTRAGRIVPEPLFVHSELTTAIQLADLAAYIICWGVRFGTKMTEPARSELGDLAQAVSELRYRTERPLMGYPNFEIWSFTLIEDLRAREEKEA